MIKLGKLTQRDDMARAGKRRDQSSQWAFSQEEKIVRKIDTSSMLDELY